MGFLEIDDSTVTSKVAGPVYHCKHFSTSEHNNKIDNLWYDEWNIMFNKFD